ncbi:MAG: hypothetical protein HY367_03195 [Candidatus Aenigmarchaeota archaeon]|nr:hypothetical protein [Candidatus Aenigmarchaeota archaeon]
MAGMESSKGQTTMVLIVLVIIIFAGLALFILSLTNTFSQDEYINLYAHNMLLSVLRADTGYTDANCKLVSDLISCAYFTPSYQCGGSGPQCLDLANSTINSHVRQFDLIRKNFLFLFIVEPEGFRTGTQIKMGDTRLDCDITEPGCPRKPRFVAEEKIQKASGGYPYILNVRLVISRR